MENVFYIGMDVHKEMVELSVYLNLNQEPEFEKQIVNDERRIIKELKALQAKGVIETCYEAGCMGFTLKRALDREGIPCRVVSPGKLPTRPSDRIKTDRRDARNLARALRAGDAQGIYVSSEEDEAAREYMRARDDLKHELKRIKQQLLGFLLRKGRRYENTRYWTGKHRKWMKSLHFTNKMEEETFAAYYHRLVEAEEKLYLMDKRIIDISQTERYRDQVNRLRCFKGVDYHIALAHVCEIGDFNRFPNAESFMAFLGLVPREHSSGDKRRQGRITKSGNSHLRRLLVEASWHYRYQSPPSRRLTTRRVGQDLQIVGYTDKALKRLQRKFAKLVFRGKSKQVAVTAVSRELAGFIWGLMTNNIA
jgi:transposase